MVNPFYVHQVLHNPKYTNTNTKPLTRKLLWECKYCGENESPKCHKCVREDGKPVSDELTGR